MTPNKEINNLMAGSELRDMADFIANPDTKVTDFVMCYQTDDDIGYKFLSGSSMATLIGLLIMTKRQLQGILDDKLNEEDTDAEN
jgi:hypothetical protein